MTRSKEEVKIREELEKEIEQSMELEIKDGICQLVLSLHRLYQHMVEGTSIRNTLRRSEEEVCVISIRLEGGGDDNKMEIKEIKREALTRSSNRSVSDGNYKHKKFDWEKSLRRSSSSSTAATIGGGSSVTNGSEQRVKRGRRRGGLDHDHMKVQKSGWKY